LVPTRPFTFDEAALSGARAAAGPRIDPPPFLAAPLGPLSPDDVSLDDLIDFFCRRGGVVQGFLSRQRLDVGLSRDEEPLDDGLPVEIDNLVQWSVGDRVLRDLLAGRDVEQAKQQEWRRGVLPPGFLGWRILTDLLDKAQPLADEGRRLRQRPPLAVEVDVDLGGGRRLRGTVPEVYGDRLVPVTYSRLGATHRLQSWIRLLSLTATDDDHNWTAHTLGRPANSRSRESHSVSMLGPLDHTAITMLRDLVELRDRGLCEPLPLPLKASLSYARVRRTHATHTEAVVKAGWDWNDGRFPGECSEPTHTLVWGAGAPLPGLDDSPHEGEAYEGETTRFGALSLRLWGPLLGAEQGSW
jgi:exodeoxyribonuclease V gamma subunit